MLTDNEQRDKTKNVVFTEVIDRNNVLEKERKFEALPAIPQHPADSQPTITDSDVSGGRTVTDSSVHSLTEDEFNFPTCAEDQLPHKLPQHATPIVDLTSCKDSSSPAAAPLFFCAGYGIHQEEIDSVRQPVRVIDTALDAFFALLNSETVLSFHSYFYGQLLMHTPQRALDVLYGDDTLSEILDKMRSSRLILIP